MSEKDRKNLTFLRVLAALIAGLAGCVFIWVVTPYNNFILHIGYISDSYLPVAALAVILAFVLGLNPLLRWLKPALSFNNRQLAIIMGMLLVASVLPGQGLLRQLPYSLAGVSAKRNSDRQLARAHEAADLPPSLFPDKLASGEPAPASERLLEKLLPGETIPWDAWLGPLVTWGTFLAFCWLMMIGLSLVVLPQWKDNERLAFPLLEVQQSLTEAPGQNRLLPPVLRKPSFWIGAGIVFVLYLLMGGNTYFPDSVPSIPLEWNLGRCFTQEPFNRLPGWIKSGRIYFLFLAIAFFMPARIGFSICFFAVAYGGYVMIGGTYFPPFHYATISDHRLGGMLILTAIILWTGRAHWKRVLFAMFSRGKNGESSRDRKAGWMFFLGLAGMFGWFLWAGVQPGWALLFVALGFIVSLLVTRIVVETGMPFIRIYDGWPSVFFAFVPVSWIGPATAFLGGVLPVIFQYGSRVSAMTMVTHGLAMDEEAKPQHQTRTGLLFLGVLVIGLVVCGAVHLNNSYHHSVSLDGEQSPISPWGVGRMDHANGLLLNQQDGKMREALYNQPAHIGFGVALAGGLQWACLHFPKWPLHPVGLLVVATFYGNVAWASIFFGWLLQVLVLRYGGSRLYRSAKPFFLGLILGEVFAAVFWGLIPAILVYYGLPYKSVLIQPL